VATWAEFEREAPDVAEVAARVWPGQIALHRNEPLPKEAPWFAVSYLGTVRRDGGPRVHPICDLRQVDVARWVDIGQEGTHAVRRHWRAP
jgi:hypothetical protein